MMIKRKRVIFIFERNPKHLKSGGAIRSYEIFKEFKEIDNHNFFYIFRVYTFNFGGFLKFLVRNFNAFLKFINPFYKKDFLTSDFLEPCLIKFLSIFGRLLYLDYHDDPVLQIKYFNLNSTLNHELEEKLLRRVFLNLKAFKIIGVVSKEFKEFLEKNNPYNISKEYVIISNASSPQLINCSKLPPKLVITLISGAAPGRGIEDLIKAGTMIVKKVKDMQMILALNSFGGESSNYLNYLKSFYGKKYKWLNFKNVGFKEVPDLLSQSFVCVVPHKKNLYMDFSLPIKLFDYMAGGRPVIVTNCKATSKVVKKEKCGLVVEDNPNSFVEVIIYLWKNKKEAEKLGKNGRRAVERSYNWKNQSQKLLELVLKS